MTINGTFACEVKLLKSDRIGKGFRIPFAIVKEHQIQGLVESLDGLYHKFSDVFAPTGNPTQKKPFDFVFVKAKRAYIAFCLYVPRKRAEVFFVDVIKYELFRKGKMSIGQKSFTEQELENIAEKKLSLFKRENGGLFTLDVDS